MSQIEIREINKASLVDIDNVKIDQKLSLNRRMENYLEQIKNPYCFLCSGSAVRVRYEHSGADLRSKLKNYFINTKNS